MLIIAEETHIPRPLGGKDLETSFIAAPTHRFICKSWLVGGWIKSWNALFAEKKVDASEDDDSYNDVNELEDDDNLEEEEEEVDEENEDE